MPRSYAAAEARKIVGVSQRQLDYWDERGIVAPSAQAADGKGSTRQYSFGDLLRLTVVKKLRDQGISLQKIRSALKVLKSRKLERQPLDEVLLTDGKSIFRDRNGLHFPRTR